MSVMTLLLDRLILKICKRLLSSCSSLFSVTLTVSMCVPCRLPLLQSCTVWTWRANTACLRTRTAKWLWFRSAALSVQWTESRWRSRRSSTRVRRHKPHQSLLFSCENVFNNRCLQGRVQCFHFLSVVLRSRCCDSARQDQHVPVQPSEGGGQAEGETKGETLSAESWIWNHVSTKQSTVISVFPLSKVLMGLTEPLSIVLKPWNSLAC